MNPVPGRSLWDNFIDIRDKVYVFFSTLDQYSEQELSEVQCKLGINGHVSEEDTFNKLKAEMQKVIIDVCKGRQTLVKKHYVDFTHDTVVEIKEQLMEFALLATSEKYPNRDIQNPTRDVVQAIEKLVDPMKFGVNVEYQISSPIKLGNFFTQQYMTSAAIKYQSQILWDTTDGLPEFHDIWDLPEDQMSSQVRKEAMQLEMYKYRKLIPPSVTQQLVCPPVYAKLKSGIACTYGWQRTGYNKSTNKFESLPCSFPEWIAHSSDATSIQTFLNNRDIHSFDLDQHMPARNIVYYFVWKDDNAEDYNKHSATTANASNINSSVRKPSSVQVYVGKARNGVHDRWLYNLNSHCSVASRLLNHTAKLHKVYEKYTAHRHESSPTLVECCQALSVARASDCALFVLYSFSTESVMEAKERRLIDSLKTTCPYTGLNERTGN